MAIAAGGEFSLALGSDGAGGGVVWAWGKNSGGQLGDGTLIDKLRAVRWPTRGSATGGGSQIAVDSTSKK